MMRKYAEIIARLEKATGPKVYAGIGSRETPDHILDLMNSLAIELQSRGFTLRSGGAAGADTAFERGAGIRKEIYRPEDASSAALSLAERFHPNWSRCSYQAKLLHARNGYQVLGRDLNSPVRGVICWTKDGKASGGTGQAIRIAEYHRIPVFNLRAIEAREADHG